MKKTKSNERRLFPRLGSSTLIKYKILSDEERMPQFSVVNIKNIGEGGVSFKVEEPIAVSSIIELKLQLPPLPDPISTLAKVMWVRKLKKTGFFKKGDKYEVGVQFVSLDENSRKTLAERIGSVAKKDKK